MLHLLRSATIGGLIIVLTACATTEEVDATRDWSAERLYSAGKTALKDGDYTQAVKYYEKLEARYPYGVPAEQAQLDTIYAYYKDDDMASAIAAANRFIRLHPTHANVDYAYYLRGLANFNDRGNAIERMFTDVDMSDRDQRASRDAYDSFREVVDRFPSSRYAHDSRQRMNYLVEVMARYEIHVASYYLRRGALVAAVNRCRYVLEKYPRTPAIEDALGIQSQAYVRMGLPELSRDSLRVLRRNFPGSRYLDNTDTASTQP